AVPPCSLSQLRRWSKIFVTSAVGPELLTSALYQQLSYISPVQRTEVRRASTWSTDLVWSQAPKLAMLTLTESGSPLEKVTEFRALRIRQSGSLSRNSAGMYL